MTIDYQTLLDRFRSILGKVGFDPPKATTIAGVFADNTLDGVFSHGINRFPRFIADVRAGTVDPEAVPVLANSMGSLEQWDGLKGPGILNALHCTERAVRLAKNKSLDAGRNIWMERSG